MAARTAEAAMRGTELVIHDVPLLFENGLESMYPDVVLVYVPQELQLKRLVESRGLTDDRARAIIAAQMPIDEKRGLAQHVIDNSGSRDQTRDQVRKLWPLIAR